MPLSAFTSERILDTCFTGEKINIALRYPIKSVPGNNNRTFFNYCFVVFGVIQKINILDVASQALKMGRIVRRFWLRLLTFRIDQSFWQIKPKYPFGNVQLREEEWSEFFFWLLNSLEVWIM